MEITEVKVRVMTSRTDKLRAFCSITFDNAFVVRDLKVIEGAKGVFVAMPSRKIVDRCAKCGGKNHIRASFCNECGTKLDQTRLSKDEAGRPKLYVDIAHPINLQCRTDIEQKVLAAYKNESEKAKQPGYKSEVDSEPVPGMDN